MLSISPPSRRFLSIIQKNERDVMKKKHKLTKTLDGNRARFLDLAFLHSLSPQSKFNTVRLTNEASLNKNKVELERSALINKLNENTRNIQQVILSLFISWYFEYSFSNTYIKYDNHSRKSYVIKYNLQDELNNGKNIYLKLMHSLKNNIHELSILIITDYILSDRPHKEQFDNFIHQLPVHIVKIVWDIVLIRLKIDDIRASILVESTNFIEVKFFLGNFKNNYTV